MSGSTSRCPTRAGPSDWSTSWVAHGTPRWTNSALLFKEYDNLYLDDANEYPFERSAGEEPLRLPGARRLQRPALV